MDPGTRGEFDRVEETSLARPRLAPGGFSFPIPDERDRVLGGRARREYTCRDAAG